jgi:hypothetical protein
MTDWTAFVEQVLTDLGGQTVCIPGAKLHVEVSKRALRQGDDFGEYLRSKGVTFAQFLGLDRRIVVHRRLGSDILVGFDGAALPTRPGAARATGFREYSVFRDDAYAAFTRVSHVPYVYIPVVDQFTTGPGDARDRVEVPPVTLDDLLEQRRAFAKSLDDEDARDKLIQAIERSANPLATFHLTLGGLRLARHWHDFNYKAIRDKILTWAEEKGVEVSPAWFSERPEGRTVETPQQVLSELARHMTDEEIRSIAIPFRAVEEMYRALPRRQES